MVNKLDIVGIGTPSIDIIHTQKGDFTRPGGCVVTTITALSRWSMRTGVIGRAGNDPSGRIILKDLVNNQIDISRFRVDDKETCRWHIYSTKDEREMVKSEYYTPLGELNDDDESYIKNSGSLLIRLNNALLSQALGAAKKYKKDLFLTFHLLEDDLDIINKIKEYPPKIIFMNEGEYEKCKDYMELFTKNKIIVVVTYAAKGCVVHNNGRTVKYSGFKVKPLDPTGAGDMFVAGFLFGYLNDWDMSETAVFANACGAIATTEYGAREKIPTIKDAEELAHILTGKS